MSNGDKGAVVASGTGEEVGDRSVPSSASGEVTMALGVEEAVGSGSWHRSSTIVGSGSVHKMFRDSPLERCFSNLNYWALVHGH
jgi:hypothetical protein